MRGFSLNFRSKLLLAMAVIISIVSMGTLFVTQKRVQASYEHMFRRQFERQIDYFTALQDTRLAGVRDDCVKLAQSDRVIQALQSSTPDVAALYAAAEYQLRSDIGDLAAGSKNIAPAPGPRFRRPRAAFYRF